MLVVASKAGWLMWGQRRRSCLPLCEAACGGIMVLLKSMTDSKFNFCHCYWERSLLTEYKRNVDFRESPFGTTLNQPKQAEIFVFLHFKTLIIQPQLTKILSENKARLLIKYYSGEIEKVDHVLKLVTWALGSDWIGCSLFVLFTKSRNGSVEVVGWDINSIPREPFILL